MASRSSHRRERIHPSPDDAERESKVPLQDAFHP